MAEEQPVTGNEGNGNQPPVVEAARPEYLPESYWDPEAKSVKADALKTDFAELATLRTARDTRAAAIPQDGKYSFDLPKEFPAPAGQKWVVDPNDPVAKAALEYAAEHKLTQAEMTGLAKMWAKVQVGAMGAERARFAEDMKALGTGAETLRTTSKMWLESQDSSGLTKDEAAEFAPLLNSRHGINAIQKMMKRGTVTTRGQPGNGADEPPPKSIAERMYSNNKAA